MPFLAAEALKGRIDLFITPSADEPDRFVYEKLLDEKVYLAVPEDWDINEELSASKDADTSQSGSSAIAAINADQFRSLCSCPFIMLREGQHIGQMMERLFEKYRCHPEKIIRAEQTLTSLGVSLITDSSIRRSGLSRFPKLYLADETICTRSMYVAYPRNKYLSKAASEFIKTLKTANA